MSEIKNYEDLLRHKEQLESELQVKRDIIRMDIVDLKREWKPVAGLLSGLGNIPTKLSVNTLLGMGLGVVGEILLKNTFVGRTGWIAKLALPFLAKRTPQLLNSGFVRKVVDRLIHRTNGVV